MKQSNQMELSDLVNRFWNGESSIREEERLRELLKGENVPAEYEGLAQYFRELGNDPEADFSEGQSGATRNKGISLQERILIAMVVCILVAMAIWYIYATRKLGGDTSALPIDTSSFLSTTWDETFVLFRDLIILK
jgi:hypothetical protein